MAGTGLDVRTQLKFLPHGAYTQAWKTDNGIIYEAGHWVAHNCVMLEYSQGTTVGHEPFPSAFMFHIQPGPGQWPRYPAP